MFDPIALGESLIDFAAVSADEDGYHQQELKTIFQNEIQRYQFRRLATVTKTL